jgi:hypothetical protein
MGLVPPGLSIKIIDGECLDIKKAAPARYLDIKILCLREVLP